MPELSFRVRGATAARSTAAPAVELQLEIACAPSSDAIQSVLLNCQLQLEAPRRRHTDAEQQRLRDVFGEPGRWMQTLRPLLWANLTTTVPAFADAIGVKLAVPCPVDFSFAATKYLHAVQGREVPVTILFSGTIFYRADGSPLQAAPIPWNAEARFALPAEIWRECVELCHPNTTWLGLRRDVFDRLCAFKSQHGLATFEDAVERMIDRLQEAEA